MSVSSEVAAARPHLSRSAAFWFAIALIGQWAFAYYIVVFYGISTFHGDFAAWTKNTFLFKGYVAGDTPGNLFFAAHALVAAVTSFGGVIQLIPQIRTYALPLHRWNGRLFLLAAFAVALTGLYLVWIRGTQQSGAATTLNAVLIIACGSMAWRAVRAGDIETHRRWALRTFLVANGQWFIRVGAAAWLIVTHAVGIKGTFSTFILFWSYGCYLVPLVILELYLRSKESQTPSVRSAMAVTLFVLTAFMSLGVVATFFLFWQPLLAKV